MLRRLARESNAGIPQFLEDGTELWDDALSEEELEMICGVYKAETSAWSFGPISLIGTLTHKISRDCESNSGHVVVAKASNLERERT